VRQGVARVLRWVGLLEAARRGELRRRMRQSRALPDAVILGAQKCGTTSLHGYLVQHPGVIEPLRKEVHYFDLNHGRGEAWYRGHFGLRGEPGLNLDSSPYYLFHPAVPQRLRALLPDARLIVLLRDPVRRAYSSYWHQRDKGRETLSFEDATAAESARAWPAHARLADGTLDCSREHQHFSYLARGRYAEQLERWFESFPREQFLILCFEDLARDPLGTLNTTLGFLGLPPAGAVSLEARHTRKYPPMSDGTAARLRDYFEPHNRRLEALLGRAMGW
jgi:hypothetical protein